MKYQQLLVMAETVGCRVGANCPRISRTESGTYIIQGKKPTRALRASVVRAASGNEIPGDEDIVEVPAELIATLVARFNG